METGPQHERSEVQTGQITFTAGAVEQFRDEFVRTGKVSPDQAREVTSALEEEGPQIAIQKLASFLEQLSQ